MPDTPETSGAPGDAAALRAENGRLREANERLRMLLEDKDAQIAELAERVARLERLISRNARRVRRAGRGNGLAARPAPRPGPTQPEGAQLPDAGHWHGVDMKADDWILLSFPTGNRDPAQFDQAFEVVIDRQVNGTPLSVWASTAARLVPGADGTSGRPQGLARPDPGIHPRGPGVVTWSAGQIRGLRTLPLRIG